MLTLVELLRQRLDLRPVSLELGLTSLERLTLALQRFARLARRVAVVAGEPTGAAQPLELRLQPLPAIVELVLDFLAAANDLALVELHLPLEFLAQLLQVL